MSEYTDKNDNIYKITNTVLLTDEEKELSKKEIAEELYKVFTRK